MRDALSILDQAQATTDNHVSLAIAEEITGISMAALDNFVANVLAQETSKALKIGNDF